MPADELTKPKINLFSSLNLEENLNRSHEENYLFITIFAICNVQLCIALEKPRRCAVFIPLY